MHWIKRQITEHRFASTVFGLCIAGMLVTVIIFGKLGYSLFRWKAYIWAQNYWTTQNPDAEIPDNLKHLIFVMVDHYEHGVGERAVQANKKWCQKFRVISDSNHDDYGNKFRYTWFYPYDHHNDPIMKELSRMAYGGYGEIEMHWHLGAKSGITNTTYGAKLQEAIEWYQGFGAMITETGDTSFAYIAGVWDLDASRPAKTTHGITNQIQELFTHGCYADFTFSTIGTPAQPEKVNAIYYVTDDPIDSKSHNIGIDAKAGKIVDDRLMIFQGPIAISMNGKLEYAAVENDPSFKPERIDSWIKANIHVYGRPEWIFVKVYSHGAQSSKTVLDHDLGWMLKSVKEYCKERGIQLHFMTAREAYNVVKAAEAGEMGNPEQFRNYKIAQYLNMIKLFNGDG